MVQVDIFWTYGIGAGFALAAGQQLVKAKQEKNASPFDSPFFVKTLLFLSILFVPSGTCLLWSNPSWETMHVGTYQTIPAWLVVIFCMTNITQGILGYWVTYSLMLAKKYYLAFLQLPLGYFGMFFILVNGWDNQGYQRFFSANHELFLNWSWSNLSSFLTSDVAIILLAFAPFIIPIIVYWMSSWLTVRLRFIKRCGPEIRVTNQQGKTSGSFVKPGFHWYPRMGGYCPVADSFLWVDSWPNFLRCSFVAVWSK